MRRLLALALSLSLPLSSWGAQGSAPSKGGVVALSPIRLNLELGRLLDAIPPSASGYREMVAGLALARDTEVDMDRRAAMTLLLIGFSRATSIRPDLKATSSLPIETLVRLSAATKAVHRASERDPSLAAALSLTEDLLSKDAPPPPEPSAAAQARAWLESEPIDLVGALNAFNDVFEVTRGGEAAVLKVNAAPHEAEVQARAHAVLVERGLETVLVPRAIAESANPLPPRNIPEAALENREANRRILLMEKVGGVSIAELGLYGSLENLPAAARRWLERPILPKEAEQLLRAVRALHAAGISHGDLDPLNVLVRQEGGRTIFSLIDWEFGSTRATSRSKAKDAADAEQLLAGLTRDGFLARADRGPGLDMTGPGDEEPLEVPLLRRTWGQRLALGGLVVSLALLPALVFAGGGPWAPGTFIHAPSLRAGLELLWQVPLGAVLGAASVALARLEGRLASGYEAQDDAAPAAPTGNLARLAAKHPLSPLLVGELGLRAAGEEIGFRMFGYQILASLLSGFLAAPALYPVAAVGVALFFAARHKGGSFWARALSSLVYSAAYLAAGTIWLAAAAHFFHNYLVVLRARARARAR